MKTNYLRNFTLGLLFATGAYLSANALPASPQAETQVNFSCGDMKPDPNRNLVYIVDQTDNALLEYDTGAGALANQTSILDGATQGSLAISPDGKTIYLAESAENKILSFSLPDLTPKSTLTLNFAPGNIVVGAGGRLYCSKSAGINNLIVEVSTSTGSIVQTFGTSESYYYPPLLRTTPTGTNLYAGEQGLSGFDNIYQYDITGTTVSSATAYAYDSENMEDFQPDEVNSRILVMNGGIYGVNVINTTNDDFSTVWPLKGAYGVAVSLSPTGTVVFAGAGDPYTGDVKTFNRADGTPLADNVVTSTTDTINAGGLAATPNGNCMYIRQDTFSNPNKAYIGIIGPITGNITPSTEPLGGASVGNGYFYNPNLGYYNESYYPWIYHINMGWMYCDLPKKKSTDVYLYSLSPKFGWLYTTPALLPYIYSFTESTFLYYEAGTTNFYNMTTNQAEYHLPPP